MNRSRVLISAGFSNARHVLALAELLYRDGHELVGVLTVSPWSVKRMRSYVRQRGMRFLVQAVPRLLGRSRATHSNEDDALESLLDREGIQRESLSAWAQRRRVPYRTVASINDQGAVALVRESSPDWVVYGGGGIIREAFIEASRGRILNAHSGPLPEVRGMNACEWSLLLGHPPTVTIHLIDRGIDTGAALHTLAVDVNPGDTIQALRSRCAALGVEGIRDVLERQPNHIPERLPEARQHRQCFVLAPALKERLQQLLLQDDNAADSNGH